MNEVFSPAAENGQTCCVNGIQLHSRYNPQKEAERFVQLISTDFIPAYIVVTGPALSYCAPFLRRRFPSARLVAVQYSPAFSQVDNVWDKVCLSDSGALDEELYGFIGEENWGATLFISWKPSEAAYPDDFAKTWRAIKQASIKCRNVLATRVYFNRRWLKNNVQFCLKTKKIAQIVPGSQSILVAASGPSLSGCFPLIKKHRKSFFLLALSSAVPPLLRQSIIPDLIITTDGGYWAKVHLSCLERETLAENIPVAAAMEAAIPSTLFTKTSIIPLVYGDCADSIFARLCGLPQITAKRNGTVSGTAAELALSLTDGPVFFCGLDLTENPQGYAHTQPNALEKTASIRDFRLETAETRHTAGFTQKGALEIYASWFSSRNDDFTSRVFRIRPQKNYRRKLFPLRDIDFDEVLKKIQQAGEKKILIHEVSIPPAEQRRQLLREYLKTEKKRVLSELKAAETVKNLDELTIFWLKTIRLGTFLQFERGKNSLITELATDCADFFDKLIDITEVHKHAEK